MPKCITKCDINHSKGSDALMDLSKETAEVCATENINHDFSHSLLKEKNQLSLNLL
jgi:hypothetical protein